MMWRIVLLTIIRMALLGCLAVVINDVAKYRDLQRRLKKEKNRGLNGTTKTRS